MYGKATLGFLYEKVSERGKVIKSFGTAFNDFGQYASYRND